MASTTSQQQPQASITFPILRKFAAGGVSCAIASAILNPCDLIKVRLQTQNELQNLTKHEREFRGFFHAAQRIMQEEGTLALWQRGLAASMLRELTYSSARMGLYEPARDFLNKFTLPWENQKHESGLMRKILAGAMSGALGSSIVNPIDLIKIRFQAEVPVAGVAPKYTGVGNAFATIYKQEGVAGLYKGVSATMVRASILTAAQMSSYDHSKHYLMKTYPGVFKDNIYTHLTCAAISGLVTSAATSPVDVIKTRYMNDQLHHTSKYKSVVDCFVKTVKYEGATALYKGFLPNYLRLGPHFVISFPLFEICRRAFGIETV